MKKLNVSGRMLDGDEVREEVLDLLHRDFYDEAFDNWCDKYDLDPLAVEGYLEAWDLRGGSNG